MTTDNKELKELTTVEIAMRITVLNDFRKFVAKQSTDDINLIIAADTVRRKRYNDKIALLNGFYLKGQLPEKRYDALCAVFPNISGIGFNTEIETKSGNKQKVHINPNALNYVSPDTDFQLLKVLQMSNAIPARLKSELIKVDKVCKDAREHALEVSHDPKATSADKKDSLRKYEESKKVVDGVIIEIEKATNVISKAKTSAEKLLEIVKEDINKRVLMNQSKVSEIDARIKWSKSILAFRRGEQSKADFLKLCKELGIESDFLKKPTVRESKISISMDSAIKQKIEKVTNARKHKAEPQPIKSAV